MEDTVVETGARSSPGSEVRRGRPGSIGVVEGPVSKNASEAWKPASRTKASFDQGLRGRSGSPRAGEVSLRWGDRASPSRSYLTGFSPVFRGTHVAPMSGSALEMAEPVIETQDLAKDYWLGAHVMHALRYE